MSDKKDIKSKGSLKNRRQFLKSLSLTFPSVLFIRGLVIPGLLIPGLSSCKNESYTRPARRYSLGEIRNYLFKKVFLREKQLLIVRRDKGWSALSAKCSRDGCDLTYQERTFYCPCCSSHFSHQGKALQGPARKNLSWYAINSKGNLFEVDTGKPVSSSNTYTTDEIEKVISEYGFEFKEVDEIDMEAVKLPQIFYEE